MKSILFSAVFILPAILFLDSCTNKTEKIPCGDPLPSYMQVCLVDNNDSSLIGKTFNQDSIKLTVENKLVDLQFYRNSILIPYQLLEEYNNSDYSLYLSMTDSDTINLVVHHQYQEGCGNYYGITSFSYNLQSISQIGGLTYKIIKK